MSAASTAIDAARWDAELEIALAAFIESYVEECPAPAGSALVADALRSAEKWRQRGRERLRGTRPRLEVVR